MRRSPVPSHDIEVPALSLGVGLRHKPLISELFLQISCFFAPLCVCLWRGGEINSHVVWLQPRPRPRGRHINPSSPPFQISVELRGSRRTLYPQKSPHIFSKYWHNGFFRPSDAELTLASLSPQIAGSTMTRGEGNAVSQTLASYLNLKVQGVLHFPLYL